MILLVEITRHPHRIPSGCAQFSQFWNLLTNPTHPYLLYFDSTTGTLQVGTWGNQITAANYRDRMLVFKFGGVVGSDLNGTTFALSNIKFNPMTTPASVTNWATVPYFASADHPKNVSDATSYHTLSNIKVGKGDPCKLVGLTVAQIQAGTIDNKLYRLPTNAENVSLASGLANGSPPSAGKYTVSGSWTASSPGLGTFPIPNPDIILPGVGRRDDTGLIDGLGTWGLYWSSTPYTGTQGYRILFSNTQVQFTTNNYFSFGHTVRCVPQ